jgi:hypothetical protein
MIDVVSGIGAGVYLAVCVSSLLLGVVAVILLVIGQRNRQRAQASRGWLMVLGKISASRVLSANVEGGSTYASRNVYAYDVNGRAYENARLALGGTGQDSSAAAAQRAAARYPARLCTSITTRPTRRIRCSNGVPG